MRSTHGRAIRARVSLALAALAVAGVVATVANVRSQSAIALAPCQAHSNTAEELAFVSLLQSWRDQNIPGSFPLLPSASLNAAAAGYAQFLSDTPGAGGHYADGGADGRAWADRAIQCGYPANAAAGGEGLAVIEKSSAVTLTPSQALSIMASGGGISVPAKVGPEVRCYGVAHIGGLGGKKDSWVVLLFGTWTGVCPQSVSATPSATQTNSGIQSPTLTPTLTPTATPTRTPSPTGSTGLPRRVSMPALAVD